MTGRRFAPVLVLPRYAASSAGRSPFLPGTAVAPQPATMIFRARSLFLLFLFGSAPAAPAGAQAPAPPPPPLWDVQVGASYVGTGGNTETSTVGADFAMNGRWPVWQIESTATAVRA